MGTETRSGSKPSDLEERTFFSFPVSEKEKVVVGLTPFKGKQYLSIRKMYLADDGDYHHGRQGINVSLEHLTLKRCAKFVKLFTLLGSKAQS